MEQFQRARFIQRRDGRGYSRAVVTYRTGSSYQKFHVVYDVVAVSSNEVRDVFSV